MYLPKVTTYAILMPLAWVYGAIVSIRNRMFDRGQLESVSFEGQVKVICVGNLAVGGTGKTPHTEYLIRLLQRKGVGPIAVLSRGYKRQSKGFVLAEKGITAARLGDESYQLFRKFPEVIVAVDADRPHGIRELLKLPVPPKVILLDDAMQHRYVKPGLTICLTSYHRILYKDAVLPAGRLREPARNVSRADIVLITKCPKALRKEELTEIAGYMPTDIGQPIYYTAYRYSRLVNLASGQPVELPATTQVLVVAGIADPGVMEQYVNTHYRFLDRLIFGDHHHFSAKDIKKIRECLDNVNSAGFCTNDSGTKPVIITTEKDAARLVDHPAVDDELKRRIYYLPTEAYFLNGQDSEFDQKILEYVNAPLGK